ncbi:nuclear transport factor 2 family protein [Sphingomonas donggukensis]|uniref:Nuclear transport factor 2 family protein n=1 Tax=Sphingomonas donggukensis TaxID=2949093 RepID=A0ABY4TWB9_9SPHN|nr:nuclear transport factor 2 family protein [Sphingomonas donggukensis]URW76709.1 nuclear transport factor 2 family protein [Sphingomonas donggukensis]
MILLALLLQTTPIQPLPKAVPLPPPDADSAAVLAPINRMFAALTARDAAQIAAQTRADGRATAVVTRADGTKVVRTLSWAEFAAGVPKGTERLEERLINPSVDIDGDIAVVWSPYVFTIDGKSSHCGTDHFDMVRDAGGWRVLNITWTQRTTDCPAP